MQHNNPIDRFDRLLSAMAPKAIPKKKPLGGQASDAERDTCSSDIQTRPDTSEDACR